MSLEEGKKLEIQGLRCPNRSIISLKKERINRQNWAWPLNLEIDLQSIVYMKCQDVNCHN